MAAKVYDATSTLADRVHFVHLYVIEPHPKAPDVGPYAGTVSEAVGYSTKSQPRTYAERQANATDLAPFIEGRQLLLLDDLAPGQYTNPVWCTYGTCPNCAFLIRQDGTVDTVQTWFNASAMEQAIRSLLAR